MPKAIPYGVYDVGADEGWVSVGDDHDTGAFAVNGIRRCWETASALLGYFGELKGAEVDVVPDGCGVGGWDEDDDWVVGSRGVGSG